MIRIQLVAIYLLPPMARLPHCVWVNAVGEIKTARPWDHLPSLVAKLRLALEKFIIKINCSQQRTM